MPAIKKALRKLQHGDSKAWLIFSFVAGGVVFSAIFMGAQDRGVSQLRGQQASANLEATSRTYSDCVYAGYDYLACTAAVYGSGGGGGGADIGGSGGSACSGQTIFGQGQTVHDNSTGKDVVLENGKTYCVGASHPVSSSPTPTTIPNIPGPLFGGNSTTPQLGQYTATPSGSEVGIGDHPRTADYCKSRHADEGAVGNYQNCLDGWSFITYTVTSTYNPISANTQHDPFSQPTPAATPLSGNNSNYVDPYTPPANCLQGIDCQPYDPFYCTSHPGLNGCGGVSNSANSSGNGNSSSTLSEPALIPCPQSGTADCQYGYTYPAFDRPPMSAPAPDSGPTAAPSIQLPVVPNNLIYFPTPMPVVTTLQPEPTSFRQNVINVIRQPYDTTVQYLGTGAKTGFNWLKDRFVKKSKPKSNP